MSIDNFLQNTNVLQLRLGKHPATTLYRWNHTTWKFISWNKDYKKSIKCAITFGLELKKNIKFVIPFVVELKKTTKTKMKEDIAPLLELKIKNNYSRCRHWWYTGINLYYNYDKNTEILSRRLGVYFWFSDKTKH